WRTVVAPSDTAAVTSTCRSAVTEERVLPFTALSDRCVLRRLCRLACVWLPVALFDAACPLVPGDGRADMVRASPLTSGSDFVLRSARCQGKHLIAEGCRGATTVTWFRGRSRPAAALPLRWSNCLGRRRGRLGRDRSLRACAIARQHTLGRLQFAELPSQLLPLRIDPRERLADPLLLLSNLI